MLKEIAKNLNEEEDYLRIKVREAADNIRLKFEETSRRLDDEIIIHKTLLEQKEKFLDELKVERSAKQPVEVSFGFMISE